MLLKWMLLFRNNLNWAAQILNTNWVTMCVSSISKSNSFKDSKSTNENIEMKSALYLKKKKTHTALLFQKDLT